MRLRSILLKLALFVSGLVIGVSLLVYDELLTLAIYSPRSQYPYPLLGAFNLYEASYFPFGAIILSFLTVIIVTHTTEEK